MTRWIHPLVLISMFSSGCIDSDAQEIAPPAPPAPLVGGRHIDDACIRGRVLDGSPECGLQPDCSVSEFTGDDEYIVPPCRLSGPSQRCWEAVLDRDVCPDTATGLRIEVRYPPGQEPACDTDIDFECARP